VETRAGNIRQEDIRTYEVQATGDKKEETGADKG